MKLRTAQQLALTRSGSLPLGQKLWQETGQVLLPSPLASASGRLGDQVYMTRPNGRVVVRAHKDAHDPRTSSQLRKRTYLPEAQRHWSRISGECRRAWGAWALRTVYADVSSPPKAFQAGYLAYVKVQVYNQAMGHGPAAAAPGAGLPAPVLSVEQTAPPADGAFAFRVRHGATGTAGLRLLVEMTSSMPTLNRAPRERDLVWFAEEDPDAFLPLRESGAVYVISNPRHPVPAGRRFGLRVRIVTEEGVPGEPIRADLIKAAPEELLPDVPPPAPVASTILPAWNSTQRTIFHVGAELPMQGPSGECGFSSIPGCSPQIVRPPGPPAPAEEETP